MVLKKGHFLSLWAGIKSCGEPQHKKEHKILKLEAELKIVKKEAENSGVDSPEKGRSITVFPLKGAGCLFLCVQKHVCL